AEISAEIPQEISAPAPKAAAPTVANMAEEILEFVPGEPEPVKAEVPPPPPPPPPPVVAPPRTAKVEAPTAPKSEPPVQEIELDQEYELVLSPEPEPEALSPIVPPAPEKSPAHAASQALASDQ